MNKLELEQYIEQNFSTHQIAKITGKGQTTIRYWLKRFNIKTKKVSFSNGYSEKQKIIENGVEFKICPQCKEKKNLIQEFYVRDDKITHSWCKACVNKKNNRMATTKKTRSNKL